MSPRLIVAVLCVVLFETSWSSECPIQVQSPQAEWVVSNGVGGAWTRRSDIQIRQPSTNTNLQYAGVRWEDERDQMPPIYNFRAVRWGSHAAKVGYGFEFVHCKMIAKPTQTIEVSGTLNGSPYNHTEPLGTTLQEFTLTNGLNLFHGVAAVRNSWERSERYPSGRTQAYGGVGLGIAIPHPVTRFDGGESTGGYRFGGFSWHAFGGIEYRFDPRIGAFVEAKATTYRADVAMDEGSTGSTRLATFMVHIGTTVRF